MGFFNKLKSLYNKIFRRNNSDELNFFNEEKTVKQLPMPEAYEHIDLPENELVSFSDEVLDTSSKVSIEKFKHNLEVLIKRTKETGKIDKFMLIREDDFFPVDWEWRVLSKNTNLESECTRLSWELKKAYALEQSGIKPDIKVKGVRVPTAKPEQINEALSKVDKTFGSVLLPSVFRSTKHFTVNTPLGVTGDYNNVHTNRDYIIIDNINSFLQSEYAYSVSYHDAYLDISHESLPISQEAVVLINDKNYERIMSDKEVASQLAQRRIVRFKVDETDEKKAKDGENMAINMILTEMGVLPSQVCDLYAHYDDEIDAILDKSIKSLAEENDLFFDKNHGGELSPDGGHFSNHYDEKNQDHQIALNEFIAFLRQKFPEQKDLFSEYARLTESDCVEIVEKLGTTALSEAINEYNELAINKATRALEDYKEDRKNITPEVHKQFVETVDLINDFYKGETHYESYEARTQTEEAIRKFIQGDTVSEQLEAARSVWELLPNKNLNKTETTVGDKTTINMKEIVSNAITKGISTEHVLESDNEEYRMFQEQQMEGEIKYDK